MKAAESSEIEKDLIQWSRFKWASVILMTLLAQSALLFNIRSVRISSIGSNPKEPLLSFASPSPVFSESLALEDPGLFARAHLHGFSGAAWVAKPPWAPPAEGAFPRPSFLLFDDTRSLSSHGMPEPPPARLARPIARPAILPSTLPARREHSEVILENPARPIVALPPIPMQYATDVLQSTVVQVLVDSDGSVFSARVLDSSGSKGADNDALRLAKAARFEPLENRPLFPGQITSGKLIFKWYAVDPGATNSVGK